MSDDGDQMDAKRIYSLLSYADWLRRMPDLRPQQQHTLTAIEWVVNLLESGDYAHECDLAQEWLDDFKARTGRR